MPAPYLDPVLRSGALYGRFISLLVNAGLVEVSEGLCSVGVFAVETKGGRQRLVVDARRANCFFADPPCTPLPPGGAMAQLRSGSSGLFINCLDLKDYFYHLLLPPG